MAQAESAVIPPRLPLAIVTSNRAGNTNTDARLVNCYLETTAEGELFIYKRPGLTTAGVVADSQVGRGVYFWRGAFYSIFGNKLYRDGVEVGSGLNTSGGKYIFDQILGATPKLTFNNGSAAYSYDTVSGMSAAWNTIDSDYPATTVKGLAYLNGYTYVMTPAAEIFNSALNSVDTSTSWNPVNYIRAQIEPDFGTFMAKQLVYVVALKQWSGEFFFDAGNTAGSPLGPVQGMKFAYGCSNGDSVQKIDDVLFWLCTNQSSSLQVIKMDKGAVEIVSTAAIDRLLEQVDTSIVYSWQLKITGHSFYIITFKNSNLTLAYDIVFDKWCQWTDAAGNYFPIVASSYDAQGRHVLQHENNGRLYYCLTTSYKDLNDPIEVNIITPIFDAGTRNRKTMQQITFVADQIDNSALVVRSSDDDYKTWNQPRSVDLSVEYPSLENEGEFTKRAYWLQHKKDTFFRIQAIEARYDVGVI